MKSRKFNGTLSVLALLAASGGAAMAQSTQSTDAELAALKTRVAQLEAHNNTARPKLQFSVGENTTVEFYGYIKADFIYDFDQDLGTTAFGLAALVPGAARNKNFRGQAFQTRLGVRTATQSDIGEIKAVIEGDFFGDGGGQFRLRHAHVSVGNWLFGQTWTNFMPIESSPSTLDFQGPAGITFARRTQARYTLGLNDTTKASFSIEQANGTTSDPAITAAISTNAGPVFVKLAGLVGRVDSGATSIDRWGVTLSGHTELWSGGSLQAAFTTGEAIGSYFQFGGPDVIGGVAAEDNGVTVGFTQSLNEKFDVGLVYGWRDTDNAALAGTANLQTVHASVFYKPTEKITVGAELIYGERELGSGATADATRLQTSVQFNF